MAINFTVEKRKRYKIEMRKAKMGIVINHSKIFSCLPR